MAVPLIVNSIPGQGDEWVASELADGSSPQLFYDNDAAAWVEEGDLSVDWRIPLVDQLDGRYLNNKSGLGSPGIVTHTARNLLTNAVVGTETLNILNDSLASGGSGQDDDEDAGTPPTLDELQARYHQYSGYDSSGDADDARQFIRACRDLLIALPQSSTHGPDTLAFQAELKNSIAEAKKWLAAADGVDKGGAGVKHVDFRNFRD